MLKENTSVYVPIETPDHSGLATILAVLVHLGVLGFIIYTNHATPINDKPIEMTLVTPDQLAMIQGQAAANQQAQANLATANSSNASNSNATAKTSPNSPTNPAVVAYNNDLAARQAKWQKEQQAYASQLDKEAQAEQDKFANQLNEERQKQIDNLNDLRDKMAHPEVNKPLTSTKMPKITRVSGSFAGAGTTGEASSTNANSNASNAGVSQNNGTASSDSGVSRGDYKSEVARKIYGNWQTAVGDKRKRLTAHFDISPSGDITNIVVDGADSPLKTALYQAIQSSSPLSPPPPKHYASFAHNNSTFIVP